MHRENHITGQGLQRSEGVSGCTCWARLVCGGLPCLLACAVSTAQGEGTCPHYVDRIERARPAVQRAGERVCGLSVLVVVSGAAMVTAAGAPHA